ncbi:unnamed protein product [Soboliphyme baturini]|uniref:Secreted protein n=1 Tax=Soboliphyme baturini TaxID=241478 RepID=A0A183J8L3_9BILA|nr:unnamed protein product [Soboliphyme baturini]
MLMLVLLCLFSMTLAGYYEDQYEKMRKDLEGKNITWKFGLNDAFRNMSKKQLEALSGSWIMLFDVARMPLANRWKIWS